MNREQELVIRELSEIPDYWSGKMAISEMKNAGDRNWRQTEWIGWYFQFWCKRNLNGLMTIPFSRKFGKVEFDGFFHYPVDFKSHVIKNTIPDMILLNDYNAMWDAIRDFQKIRLIIAMGEGLIDKNEFFKKWHKELKGKESKYELQRMKRGTFSRMRKHGFILKKICMLDIDREMIMECKKFQTGFRNAGGKPRGTKLQLDLNKVENQLKILVNFTEGSKPKIANLDQFF